MNLGRTFYPLTGPVSRSHNALNQAARALCSPDFAVAVADSNSAMAFDLVMTSCLISMLRVASSLGSLLCVRLARERILLRGCDSVSPVREMRRD